MVKDQLIITMVHNMKVNIVMVYNMVMEHLDGLMVQNMLDHGLKVLCKVKEFILKKMELYMKV